MSRRTVTAARIERSVGMCLSCRCGLPNEDHRAPDNITYDDLQRAAAER
jgi:hypothetical protein